MKKLGILMMLLLTSIMMPAQHAQNGTFVEGVLDDDLANRVYKAIKKVGLDNRMYTAQNGFLLFGYKTESTESVKPLEVGIYYNIESIENNTLPYREDFTKKTKDVYKLVKGKDKIKPRINFRLFLISHQGIYAMGKIYYNEKGKAWPYTNETFKGTKQYGGWNIFPGLSFMRNGASFSYTSDIMW